mmetsp:Transcript_23109/g.72092  ORF Transcript_23109/g.72092 Transcript_23109/m.72092 type:complete len:319 (-) Transcript_23109:1360-2316(-)
MEDSPATSRIVRQLLIHQVYPRSPGYIEESHPLVARAVYEEPHTDGTSIQVPERRPRCVRVSKRRPKTVEVHHHPFPHFPGEILHRPPSVAVGHSVVAPDKFGEHRRTLRGIEGPVGHERQRGQRPGLEGDLPLLPGRRVVSYHHFLDLRAQPASGCEVLVALVGVSLIHAVQASELLGFGNGGRDLHRHVQLPTPRVVHRAAPGVDHLDPVSLPGLHLHKVGHHMEVAGGDVEKSLMQPPLPLHGAIIMPPREGHLAFVVAPLVRRQVQLGVSLPRQVEAVPRVGRRLEPPVVHGYELELLHAFLSGDGVNCGLDVR